MAALTKKQLSKVQRQKLSLRNSLWPSLKEDNLWDYKRSDGWLNIPRALPLLMQIMDNMSKGKPVSSTYIDLWCRTFNDSFVVANKPREMAYFSGFSGERAEKTWTSRIKILYDLGFIDIKDGPNGPVSYILIYNPYNVIKTQHQNGNVDTRSFNSLLERMIEIRAFDINAGISIDEEHNDGSKAIVDLIDNAKAFDILA